MRYSLPAIYDTREYAVAGGLMSYGSSIPDAYRLMGIYVAKILKGAKPADLPVEQPTKFELVINLKTAKALGLERTGQIARARRRGDRMRRREFITLLGGAAAVWPLAAHAQQPGMPAIGVLNSTSPVARAHLVDAFRQGVFETGYVQDQNVAMEYRWAQDQYDRLPDLLADLIRRKVAVIAATDPPSALAAKAANTNIPIVFATGGDPVKDGLVASLNRPGGNITGVSFMVMELGAKRLGLMHELLPQAVRLAVLVDPNFPITELFVSNMRAAASTIGKQIDVLNASTVREINSVFAGLVQKPVDALMFGPSAFFNNHRVKLVTLATHHRVPAIYTLREFVTTGGLMSYGTSLTDAHRQAGIYAGRILKGEKPADLPVVQSTKFEFVINLNTAKALGLSFPPGLLAIADEVIE